MQTTPCWWFIWKTKICSVGSTFKTPPHALWLIPFPLFSLQQWSTTVHAAGLKNIPSANEGPTQYTVVSSVAHVITGWKNTDTRRSTSAPQVFACCSCMPVLASFFRQYRRKRKKSDAPCEPHQGRPGLGTFPGLRLESGCSLTHDRKISVQTAWRGTNPPLKSLLKIHEKHILSPKTTSTI